MTSAIQADLDQSIRFLDWLRPGGPWVLTAIPPEGGGAFTETFFDLRAARGWLEQKVGRLNLYFMVNPARGKLSSKAKKEDVEELALLHVDVDPRKGEDLKKEQERALKLLEDFSPPPSAIIFSGGGYQGFWKLAEGETLFVSGDANRIADGEAYNRQLEIVLGGDHCWNIDRIMRLPGTINLPDEKKRERGRSEALALIVELNELEYSLADFIAAPEVQSANSGSGVKVQISGNLPRLADLDELPEEVTPRTRMLIVQGDDPDDPTRYGSKSEAMWAVTCELVRAGCDDDMIAAVLLDPDFGISDHPLRQKRSVEYVARQIERAREEVIDPMLRKLNVTHFAVGSIGGKFRIASPRRSEIDGDREYLEYQTVADFKYRYMNRRVQTGETKEGNPVYTPAGEWWLKHPMRRQYETVVFAPGETTDELREYNLWRGLAVRPEERPWPLLRRLIEEGLAGGNPEYADYVMRWLAFAVQNPERAAEVALVFRGGRGVGKSTLGHAMRRIFGQHGMSVTHPQHLHGQFNDHLHDCVLLFADEAVAPGEKKAEQMIKVMITEPTLLIEPKGLGKFTAKNRLHVMMASNERWVVPAGADERRFAIFDVSAHLAARPGDPNEERNRAFWDALYAEIEGEGLQGFLHDLLALDLGNWHPRRGVPQTAALNEQKAASLTGFKQVWFDLLASGELPYLRTMRDCGAGHVFVSTSELLEYAQQRTRRTDLTLTEVGELLARHGCEKDDRRRPRGWIVPPLSDARRRWDEVEFPSAWRPTPGWGAIGAVADENEPY